MDWKNAADETPANRQNVLISVNGIYYDATYHKEKNCYLPKQPLAAKFTPDNFTIYWCDVSPPPVEKK